MDLHETSIATILGGQHPTGAYYACPGYPHYRYSWTRDGAFIAAAMDAVGEHHSAGAFHRWLASTVIRHGAKVRALAEVEIDRDVPLGPTVGLHTRYTTDGTEVEDVEWGTVQFDGYGFWLSSLGQHLDATRADPAPYLAAVRLVARYLTLVWDLPCNDCWEELPNERHVTTWCAVAAGLRSAARILDDADLASEADRIVDAVRARGTSDGSLTKLVDRRPEGMRHDGSALLVLGGFGPFEADDPVVTATLTVVDEELRSSRTGGVHRFRADTFYGGGAWLPLAGARAILADDDGSRDILAWMASWADDDAHLPEQVPDPLLHPAQHARWVASWGPVATPLLWSHAMYLLAERSRSNGRPERS